MDEMPSSADNHSLWIPENRFYYLHESQIEKFRRPEDRELFKKYYNLGVGEAASTGIEYFSLQILKDCELANARYLAASPETYRSPSPRRRSESGMFFSDAGSPEHIRDFEDLEDHDDQDRRKRPREGKLEP